MKKPILICLIALVLFSHSSIAEDEGERIFDESKAYEWLLEQLGQDNWGNDIETISWSIMALYNAGYDYEVGLNKLRSFESGYNWENNVYKTAIATRALAHIGENVSDEVEWLNSRQSINLDGGDWLVQFNPDATTIESTCIVNYDNSESSYIISGINVTPIDSGCSLVNGNWVSFEDCIKESSSGIYEYFDVTCSPPLGSSLIYKVGDSQYYIIDESSPRLEIENGCFEGQAGNCDCSYSQFAAWSMVLGGSSSYSIPFLKGNCNDNLLGNVFLFLLTSESVYKTWLESNQGVDGHWGNNIRDTAFAGHALKGSSYSSFNNAKEWLGFMQNQNDGSWNQDMKLTATVLFAMTEGGGTIVPEPDTSTCNNTILEVGEECDLNYECAVGETCINCQCISEDDPFPEDGGCPSTGVVCSNDCPASGVFPSGISCQLGVFDEETCICQPFSVCTFDSDCSVYGLGYTCDSAGNCNPPVSDSDCNLDSDCPYTGQICVEGTCITSAQDDLQGSCDYDYDCEVGQTCQSGTCVTSDEESGGFFKWVIAILFILIALGAGYYAYTKYFKKGGPASTGNNYGGPPKPAYPLTSQRVPIRRSSATGSTSSRSENKIEKELDEALNKAKKLIKK